MKATSLPPSTCTAKPPGVPVLQRRPCEGRRENRATLFPGSSFPRVSSSPPRTGLFSSILFFRGRRVSMEASRRAAGRERLGSRQRKCVFPTRSMVQCGLLSAPDTLVHRRFVRSSLGRTTSLLPSFYDCDCNRSGPSRYMEFTLIWVLHYHACRVPLDSLF